MKRTICLIGFIVVFSLLVTLLVPTSVGAQEITSGNNSLGMFANFTLNGGVTVAGVGLRAVGSGTISMTTIPTGASVHRAYLYWATLGFSNTYTQPTLQGQPITGQLIGTTGDTCWGVQNNFVYRADVTSQVTGNGSYTVAGLPRNLSAGNDSQGASLVVVYRHSSAPLRSIVINDGAVALNFTRTIHTNTISGFTSSNPVVDAQVTYLIGDGQAQWDTGNITFNGSPIASGVFSGVDGPYWGSHTLNVTSLVSGSSATTTISNHDPDNPDQPDCLLWAGTILSVTAAAPETENHMSLSFSRTMFGDVTSAGVGLRGSGEGTINLSGIPDNGRVQQAYLYWATLGSSGLFTNPLLNGNPVNGQRIGISGDTCWGVAANYVYRADVTHLVGGNGDYTISELPNNLAGGNDSQGASLVVVFSSPGLYRTVIINDGAVTLDLVTSTFTDRIGHFTADQPNAQTHITYLIGDGQSQWDSGSIAFEGTSIAGSVFNGADGEHWGTLRFDVTGLISEPDATTTISNEPADFTNLPDCLLWAATILAVQTEQPELDHTLFLPLISAGEQ